MDAHLNHLLIGVAAGLAGASAVSLAMRTMNSDPPISSASESRPASSEAPPAKPSAYEEKLAASYRDLKPQEGTNRQWMVVQEPKGFPVIGKDIQFTDDPIPTDLADKQVLIKVVSISLDPYVRGTMNRVSYGAEQSYPRVVHGGAIGRVVKSNHSEFKEGDLVQGYFGWQDFYLYTEGEGRPVKHVSPAAANHPSYALGVLGMPGATAYFGFLELCNPQAGETVVVSAASGAVGAIVVQIAKIKGCRVVGFAGTKDKCEYVKSLGAEECILYRGKNVEQLTEELKAAAPKGVDCYFDNTGADCTDATFANLNNRARVSVCGQIAYYNLADQTSHTSSSLPLTYMALKKQLRIEGFLVPRWKDWSPAHTQLKQWMDEGKIAAKEHVVEGLENIFDAFMLLYRGKTQESNFGKLVVNV